MVEVDARGLSCPEPIMLTADALKNAPGADLVAGGFHCLSGKDSENMAGGSGIGKRAGGAGHGGPGR